MCAYHAAIFNGMSGMRLKDRFRFSEEVRRTNLFRRCEDRQGTYDVAHLRRDDVSDPALNRVQVQGHSVLSKSAYVSAFTRYGFAPEGVQWISDDYSRRWHTDRAVTIRGGWSYPTGSEYPWARGDLRLARGLPHAVLRRTIFRANSSFSWWAAFLSPTATVYSPVVDRRLVYGVDGHEEVEYRVRARQPSALDVRVCGHTLLRRSCARRAASTRPRLSKRARRLWEGRDCLLTQGTGRRPPGVGHAVRFRAGSLAPNVGSSLGWTFAHQPLIRGSDFHPAAPPFV